MQTSGKQLYSSAKLYVVAENRLLRETLVRLFRKRSEISIVGDTCCSDSAIEDIASAKSDLLLLDCFETKHTSDDWLADLQETAPESKIILFGIDEEPDVFLRAVHRCVTGYLLKNASTTYLLHAFRTIPHREPVHL